PHPASSPTIKRISPNRTRSQDGQSCQRYWPSMPEWLDRRLTAAGTLVKCDASIKAMLVDIDSKNGNEYIIEELDEEHILVKETKVHELKSRLNQMMKERLKEPDTSDSE
ncbi:hypothetical protein IAQ61_011340, partial [Plenodomus lingam]|uniref:uncharacterized protein n=1 Tax=Leptosphaeria maculans TaxID=5022 RepID=UPI003322338F